MQLTDATRARPDGRGDMGACLLGDMGDMGACLLGDMGDMGACLRGDVGDMGACLRGDVGDMGACPCILVLSDLTARGDSGGPPTSLLRTKKWRRPCG